MSSPLVLNASLLWSCVWQTSVCLILGLAASFLWARRPARAHRVLVLAMIACLATPLLSQTVRHFGWGIFISQHPVIKADLAANPSATEQNLTATQEGRDLSASASVPEHALSAAPGSFPTGMAGQEIRTHVSWKALLITMWLVLSGFCVARLIVSLGEGVRLVARGRPVKDARIQQVVDTAIAELKLKTAPEIRLSDGIRHPQIWCWWRHPALLLPSADAEKFVSMDWRGVLCHELAHLKRRDHLAVLLGELLACVFPWQPLAWWAKRRLSNLSEQACDDWVLAGGESPTTYAQLLLTLLPERRPALALATVTGRNSVQARIHHILRGKRTDPKPGRRWACGAAVAMVCIGVGIAFAQTRAPAAEAGKEAAGEASQEAAPAMRLRRVTKTAYSEWTTAISPDGKYLCTPSTGSSLVARELATGEEQVLLPEGRQYHCDYLAISPDSQTVAYRGYDRETGTYDLQLIGLDGSGRRVLRAEPIAPMDWSPDGKRILALRPRPEDVKTRTFPYVTELIWVSTEDGSVQLVKTFGNGETPSEEQKPLVLTSLDSPQWRPRSVDLSSDGRYVAYGVWQGEALRKATFICFPCMTTARALSSSIPPTTSCLDGHRMESSSSWPAIVQGPGTSGFCESRMESHRDRRG